MFKYDEDNACYSIEVHGIRISCDNKPDVELENYSNMLIDNYNQVLKPIAQYICTEKQFVENYGRYSVKETLEMLEKNMTIPWIFLQSNDSAVIAYCDEHYVIIPEFSEDAYIAINNNTPYFTSEEKECKSAFEIYSDLDELGRCGVAYANICTEIMPTEERDAIGQIKPSGGN